VPITRQEDLTFLERAPLQVQTTHVVAHAPAVVFDALADTPSWPTWFPALRSAAWTSTAPYGIDSTRVVVVGPVRIHERFIAWEPGRQWGFTVTSTSPSVVRALVEVADLDDLGDGSTRITYTLAAEPVLPRLVARRLGPGVGVGLKRGMIGLGHHLDATATTPRP